MAPTVSISPKGTLGFPILLNTAIIAISSYEIYRVYKGAHPTISPKLWAAGVYGRPRAVVAGSGGAAEDRNDEKGGKDWIELNNGVLFPSFQLLMRPFRKE